MSTRWMVQNRQNWLLPGHWAWSILAVVARGFRAGLVGAADPMSNKEAKPTLGERFTKDTVKGTLMKMDGEYYSIEDTDGNEIKLHVDKSMKLDKVVVGD